MKHDGIKSVRRHLTLSAINFKSKISKKKKKKEGRCI